MTAGAATAAVGYGRTLPGEDTPPVRAELAAAGCLEIYCDEQVPLRADWPQLDRALAAAATGGTLVVCRLLHIGRSLEHLADLLATLDRRGVRFRALHEQLDTAEHGEQLRQIAHGLIEAQQVWRSESTRAGLAAAVAAGRKLGRQPASLLTPRQRELARQLQTTGRSVTEIAKLLGVSRGTMYRALPATRTTPTGEKAAGVRERSARSARQ